MSLTSKRYPRHPPSRALSHGTPTLLLGLPFAVAGTSSSIASRAITRRHHQHTPTSLPSLDLLFDLPTYIYKMSTPAFDPSKLAKLQAARIGQSRGLVFFKFGPIEKELFLFLSISPSLGNVKSIDIALDWNRRW